VLERDLARSPNGGTARRSRRTRDLGPLRTRARFVSLRHAVPNPWRLLAGLFSATLAAGATAASISLAMPPETLMPLAATTLASPQPVLGADNRIHLVYELFVTTSSSAVMRLKEVGVLNSGTRDAPIKAEHGAKTIASSRARIST
jgi:hypothetical protein